MRIDLNADVGEALDAHTLANDAALMPHLTSASIACGFHAGNPAVMSATLALAKEHGVAVGAHPSFPDQIGFGRRDFEMAPQEIEDMVVYQVGALAMMAKAQGMHLQHVKPHGALYIRAGQDPLIAEAVARAVATVDQSLMLFGLSGSALISAGQHCALTTVAEVFADRAYEPDGSLVSRKKPGAVIQDPDQVVKQALNLVKERFAVAVDGSVMQLERDTICLHGDTPGAVNLAVRLRHAFDDADVEVLPLGKR